MTLLKVKIDIGKITPYYCHDRAPIIDKQTFASVDVFIVRSLTLQWGTFAILFCQISFRTTYFLWQLHLSPISCFIIMLSSKSHLFSLFVFSSVSSCSPKFFFFFYVSLFGCVSPLYNRSFAFIFEYQNCAQDIKFFITMSSDTDYLSSFAKWFWMLMLCINNSTESYGPTREHNGCAIWHLSTFIRPSLLGRRDSWIERLLGALLEYNSGSVRVLVPKCCLSDRQPLKTRTTWRRKEKKNNLWRKIVRGIRAKNKQK